MVHIMIFIMIYNYNPIGNYYSKWGLFSRICHFYGTFFNACHFRMSVDSASTAGVEPAEPSRSAAWGLPCHTAMAEHRESSNARLCRSCHCVGSCHVSSFQRPHLAQIWYEYRTKLLAFESSRGLPWTLLAFTKPSQPIGDDPAPIPLDSNHVPTIIIWSRAFICTAAATSRAVQSYVS